ncbi:MAG: DNA gyrase inhibitor YacG [Bradyrhizobiaceae bacterium]|nr:MAG: DNA gyrase inhibitor YacG [Bradyrhizobiaceae bacterium]
MKPCPICAKPSVETSKPFCSERCRDIDLNRWLSGSYAIPAAEADEDDDDTGGITPPQRPV